MLTYKLESCVVSLKQAIQAQKNGADRIELCASLETEGMTPSYHLVSALCDHLKIPVRVMIRARPEGYDANDVILSEMVRSINEFKHLPIEGFVFGLMKNNRIDQEAMKILIHQAIPFPITFHKAIDLSDNIQEDIEWLNQFSSVDTILSSGGAELAIDGIPQIQKMKSWFNGEIMAAGKITPETLSAIDKELQLSWYHGSAIV